MSDSLYYKLDRIENSVEYIVNNTTPINDINQYFQITDGQIAIAALIISLVAAICGFCGFVYQMRSAKLLEIANKRRPSLYPLLERLYNNFITLSILYEYDSDYNMSYTEEMKHAESNRSSSQKRYIKCISRVDELLSNMELSDNMIILEKYETYENDNIYNLAFTIKNEIYEYNRYINTSKNHFIKNKEEKHRADSDNLYSISRRLIRDILLLDSLCIQKKQYLLKKKCCPLERELSFFIVTRFFSSISRLTPDNDSIIADPYKNILISPIDFKNSIPLKDVIIKAKDINKLRKKGNKYNPEQLLFTYIDSAIECINYIKNRTQSEEQTSVSKSALIMIIKKLISRILKQQEETYNDTTLKNRVEFCLGNIYLDIRGQIDTKVINVDQIAKYDILLQFAIQKHNLLTLGSKQAYNKEIRRIEKKAIWHKERIRQNIN